MRAYSNMPADEFIEQLRDAAIRANASPAVIDNIDALQNCDELEEEREEIAGELTDMEKSRDACRQELADLLEALPISASKTESKLRDATLSAIDTLEREGYYSESHAKQLRDTHGF